MTDEIAAPDDGARSPPKPASRGRGPAVFALLLAMAGLAGFAYLYYTVVILDPGNRIDGRLSELQGEQALLRAEVRRLNGEQHDALTALRAELEERQRAAEMSLAETLNRPTAPQPSPEPDWKLAEVEYLLRIANHRVLMERDVETALRLLNAADDILGDLDDVALHGVRATLATEILNLEQTPSADIPGIYLRLDAVKRQLSAQTLAPPEYSLRASVDTTESESASAADDPTVMPGEASAASGHSPAPGDAPPPVPEAGTQAGAEGFPEESGFLDAVAAELAGFVRFRRIDTGFKPPPSPTEASYLELNLRLMLEQAQLAALRYDQAVYATSLDAALEWVGTSLDQQNPLVQETVNTLAALRALDVETPLPDISGSLNELRNTRQDAR